MKLLENEVSKVHLFGFLYEIVYFRTKQLID